MNKLCRGGNANHPLSLRTAQAAGRWFGTAQIYAIFIEYAKNCFGFYTVNVNAAGVLRVAGFYLFSAISRQAKTSKPVSLLGTQGYAGEDMKKHSPPRTCAARGGLSVEKRGKKQGVRTTGHLRAGSKCSLQTDTHLCTDWVITQNTQSIYTLLQGCGWLAQGTKMSVKPKDKTYRSGGLRPLVLHVARLTCILLYEGGR